MGAKNGILFKTAVSLEETGKTRIVALDKTGTITRGEPKVTDVLPAEGISEEELLTDGIYTGAEKRASACQSRAGGGTEQRTEATDDHRFYRTSGQRTERQDMKAAVCSVAVYTFIREKIEENGEKLQQQAEQLAKQGKTPLLFVRDGKLLGMIAVADVIKEDSPQAIAGITEYGHKSCYVNRRQRADSPCDR